VLHAVDELRTRQPWKTHLK